MSSQLWQLRLVKTLCKGAFMVTVAIWTCTLCKWALPIGVKTSQ